MLLAALVFVRAALGAALNPPYNGPDEAGHIEYIRSSIESGGREITGVEARQRPAYYLIAATLWQAAGEQPEGQRLFLLRLLSGLAGAGTAVVTYLATILVVPGRPRLALLAGVLAGCAPGYLYLLASASNDPLAALLASVAVLATLRLAQHGQWRGSRVWWLVAAASGAGALATKSTTLPAVGACLGALMAWHWRWCWSRWWLRLAAGGVLVAGLAAYLWLLSQHPTMSFAASAAHFWPQALVRAPLAYVREGGLVESFQTYWYAYDYSVHWPRALRWLLAAPAGVAVTFAVIGLAISRGRPAGMARPATGILLAVAGAQIAFVLGRFGFGGLLQIEMGGAAQAKAFFPAILPLSVLFIAGAAETVGELLRRAASLFPSLPFLRRAVTPAVLATGCFAWLCATDLVVLAVTTWQHFRWWQIAI